jgi:DNA-binding response OmpR family regulator
MFRPIRKPFVILHFFCDPTVLTDHGMFLSNLGYRVINSNDGFETIQLSASAEIDAAVLELDRNRSDVLLIAQEIERVRASIPIIVVVHATQTLDGLRDLADAVVPREVGSGVLLRSLEELLPGRNQQIDLPPPSTDPSTESIQWLALSVFHRLYVHSSHTTLAPPRYRRPLSVWTLGKQLILAGLWT